MSSQERRGRVPCLGAQVECKSLDRENVVERDAGFRNAREELDSSSKGH